MHDVVAESGIQPLHLDNAVIFRHATPALP
jgi:hypothetical protein